MRTGKRRTVLVTVWMVVVIGAALLTLPLLAMWSIAVLSNLSFAGLVGESVLGTVVALLWPAAGAAGLAGLVAARRRPSSLRPARIRQGLLLAGIVAAMPPAVGFSVAAAGTSASGINAVITVFAVAFAALIVQAAADIWRLQGRVAELVGPTGPAGSAGAVPGLFLALAILCAAAGLIGQVLLELSPP